jgi:hypothetical protein
MYNRQVLYSYELRLPTSPFQTYNVLDRPFKNPGFISYVDACKFKLDLVHRYPFILSLIPLLVSYLE